MQYIPQDIIAAAQAIIDAAEESDASYYLYGIRFEDKLRTVGDRCEPSRDNPDREDERDFPAYGTPEYDALPMLDGTCAYNAKNMHDVLTSSVYPAGHPVGCFADHIYLIAGNHPCEGGGDCYEICLVDAVVLGVLA